MVEIFIINRKLGYQEYWKFSEYQARSFPSIEQDVICQYLVTFEKDQYCHGEKW
jgi:hypothetical protein